MQKSKMIVAILTGLISFLSSYAYSQHMRIGVSAAYEPFEFKNSKKQIVGFDIDLARAICTELKWTCVFSDQAFNNLIPSLKKNQIDMIISAFDITPESSKQVKFSNPYFHSGAMLVGLKGRFKSAIDLQDKNVGVLEGRLHAQYIYHNFPGFNVKNYNHIPTSLKDLAAGKLDAVFIDDSIALEFLKKNPSFESIGDMIQDKSYFNGGFGIAVDLDDTETIHQINRALDKINQSGLYQEIYDKWFSDTEWMKINQ